VSRLRASSGRGVISVVRVRKRGGDRAAGFVKRSEGGIFIFIFKSRKSKVIEVVVIVVIEVESEEGVVIISSAI
jgi:hypothetical protein